MSALLGHVLVVAALLTASGCAGFGRTPRHAERVELRKSPNYEGRKFRNAEPMYINFWGALGGGQRGALREPEAPLSVMPIEADDFAMPPASGLRATWLGHSTVLLELDGVTLLTDPHWGPRSSPFTRVGPKRWYASPLPLEEVPSVDAVLISHDHYDHLDHTTIQRIARWDSRFIVPLGVAGHLRRWGVPAERITELDWWEEAQVQGVKVASVPARHASGRRMTTRDRTLWAGYALVGPEHRVYFSGDTGLFSELRTIGERYGPFDLTMIEVGQYDRSWPDWHLGPESAVLAHLMVRGEVMLPVHWGLFALAPHAWTEPIERVLHKAAQVRVPVLTPHPGELLEPGQVPSTPRWWPDVTWQPEHEHPIRPTKAGEPGQRMNLDALWREYAGSSSVPL